VEGQKSNHTVLHSKYKLMNEALSCVSIGNVFTADMLVTVTHIDI